jgi:hypothetical protein
MWMSGVQLTQRETLDQKKSRCFQWSRAVTSKERKSVREPSAIRRRSSPRPSPQLVEIRAEFQAAIAKLKALGCEDTMILVEFWHALDSVNGEDCSDL